MTNYEVLVFYTDGSTQVHAVVADTKFNAKLKVVVSLGSRLSNYVRHMHVEKKDAK